MVVVECATHLKKISAIAKLDHLPRNQGKNNKSLKPPSEPSS